MTQSGITMTTGRSDGAGSHHDKSHSDIWLGLGGSHWRVKSELKFSGFVPILIQGERRTENHLGI